MICIKKKGVIKSMRYLKARSVLDGNAQRNVTTE